MKLPNGKLAIVDIRKLRDYCLNTDNPRGSARVLGITVSAASELRNKLLEIAATEDTKEGGLDLYGQRYTIDFTMATETGTANVRSGWIILHGESRPRLTTCYVKKRKRNG